ncbi:MAG: hypothetical protein Q4G03_07410 [Planctomycetia bacterium]|nr:hypothetical protein [Planctomycetia bacterium]
MIDLFDEFAKASRVAEPSSNNPMRERFIARIVEELKSKYPKLPAQARKRKLERFLERPEVERMLYDLENVAFFKFVPRPDDPANFDQQHSFCYNRDAVSFLIGGNAAGTTEAAAFKTELFVLQQQEAPRPDTPFWILSNTYQQTCATCWQEKLLARGHIPESEIDWKRVSWISRAKGWPESVPLKPWSKNSKNNWRLEQTATQKTRR